MPRQMTLRILLVVASVVASTRTICVEQNGLDVAVSTDKKVYSIGEPVRVKFRWSNVGDTNLVIVNWRGPKGGVSGGEEQGYDFSVLYDGKERLGYHGEFACGPTGSLTLESKETLTREYEISDVYSFVRPGRYVIRASYNGFAYADPDPAHWKGRITHPEIEVWVQP